VCYNTEVFFFLKLVREKFQIGYSPSTIPVPGPGRFAYQPPASSTFLLEQISHQQSASSTFLRTNQHQPNEHVASCHIYMKYVTMSVST
jgi:hypothetical protein